MNAEEQVEAILGRRCYGKQYTDHDQICVVCPMAAAVRAAERDAGIAALEWASAYISQYPCLNECNIGWDEHVDRCPSRMVEGISDEIERRRKGGGE